MFPLFWLQTFVSGWLGDGTNELYSDYKRLYQDGWVTEGMNFDDPDVLLRFDRSYATAGGRNKLFGFWYETTALVSIK